MSWSATVGGWPAAAAASAAFAAALLTTRSWLGLIAAAVAAPFCLQISGFPLLAAAARVAVATNFLSAYLLHRGRRDMAFTALLPFMIVITVLAVFMLRGIRLIHG